MQDFLAFAVVGIVTGSIYAIAASGLVVTYTTSGVFNFAHGAIGMIAAFLYWDIKEDRGWGTLPALLIVLGVFAPIFGIVIERVLMRPLAGKPTGVSLVVTVGLLLLLYGIGTTIWPGTETRRVSAFFPDSALGIAGIQVSYHQIVILVVTAAVAVGLRLVLFKSRVGVAMRAVVDNPELAALNGALPERVSQLAWVLGSFMASLAGILIAPGRSYDHLFLTLLVVNGYAAAILGRLTSLPLTFVGALGLGLGGAYLQGYGPRFDFGVGWLGTGGVLSELLPGLATVFLFVLILVLPQSRLRVGRIVGVQSPRVPGLRESVAWTGGFVALALLMTTLLTDAQVFDISSGLVVGMVLLSLVVLVGYAGQVSLCQYTFVGIGAAVMGKFFASGSPFGVVAAVVVSAGFGALVALPALRLRDIYLALVTLAFALFADKILFDHPDVFDRGGVLAYERLSIGPLAFDSDRSMLVLLAASFAAMGVVVLALRRSALGRRMSAMNDSPAACMTLGLDLVATKVTVFAISAGMAGFAGAMFGMLRTSASGNDFVLLISLTGFLLAMIGGITTVTGALIGGLALPLLGVIEANYESLNLQGLFIGGGAILVSRYPNGFAGLVLGRLARLRRGRRSAAAPPLEGVDLGGAPVAA